MKNPTCFLRNESLPLTKCVADAISTGQSPNVQATNPKGQSQVLGERRRTPLVPSHFLCGDPPPRQKTSLLVEMQPLSPHLGSCRACLRSLGWPPTRRSAARGRRLIPPGKRIRQRCGASTSLDWERTPIEERGVIPPRAELRRSYPPGNEYRQASWTRLRRCLPQRSPLEQRRGFDLAIGGAGGCDSLSRRGDGDKREVTPVLLSVLRLSGESRIWVLGSLVGVSVVKLGSQLGRSADRGSAPIQSPPPP